jgi:hypothetical protein
MVTRILKGRSARVAKLGLYAALILPCFVDGAMAACKSAPGPEAALSEWSRSEGPATEDEYLRLHRLVVAPTLFRDIEPAADTAPVAVDQLAAPDRSSGVRCDSGPGESTGGVSGIPMSRSRRS